MSRLRALVVVVSVLAVAGYEANLVTESRSSITSPLQQFGASIGDDYFLATYEQFERYWKKLDAESDRVRLVSIGTTEEGRTQWMAVVSAAENLARLDDYRRMSRRLALGEATDAEARRLAQQGKAVVWINGGLHADEVLGAQQLIELVYQLAARDDAETLRVLRDVIVLVVHANPDGHALVGDWYMQEREPTRRTLAGIPRAYQKYVGHDNNRDFFLSSQAETVNMNRVLYREWFPQIVFDHHQPAPAGTVMFAPPFSGPFNEVVSPIIPASVERVGSAMQARFAAEGKRGVTMRGGAAYSTWWNGGLRTSAYFHNQIGLLTETSGSPTPIDIEAAPGRQSPTMDLPMPIAPQRWHFRQAVDYSMSANRAVLEYASHSREILLGNAYRMAKEAIDDGGRGGYVIPSTQADFPTATKFVDALLKSGVAVHRAATGFRVNGTAYAAGTFVVKTAQPFRAHVLDMFEPQVYPGGPVPYDITGWTLAFQMGVKFDRTDDAIDGPLERIDAVTPPHRAAPAGGAAGYLLSHHENDSVIAVNRLLRARVPVYWLDDRSHTGGTGVIYVPRTDAAHEILTRAVVERGLAVTAAAAVPDGSVRRLRRVRIGLWDRYGGSSSSGWMRYILERFEFPFARVYTQDIDSGRAAEQFDVLLLPDDAMQARADHVGASIPREYQRHTGALSAVASLPALRRFVDAGGALVLVGQAAGIVDRLGAPVDVVAPDAAGAAVGVSVPGSILRVHVDNTSPLGYGFEPDVDVLFDEGPLFHVRSPGTAVAWFGASPLRSGWARGGERLSGMAAAVDVPLGNGRLLAFGPHVGFRAQSHATFKFLFNAILYPQSVRLPGLP